jgi:hypothetical protein
MFLRVWCAERSMTARIGSPSRQAGRRRQPNFAAAPEWTCTIVTEPPRSALAAAKARFSSQARYLWLHSHPGPPRSGPDAREITLTRPDRENVRRARRGYSASGAQFGGENQMVAGPQPAIARRLLRSRSSAAFRQRPQSLSFLAEQIHQTKLELATRDDRVEAKHY